MTSGGVGQTGIATLGKQCKQGAVYRSAARPAAPGRTAADAGEVRKEWKREKVPGVDLRIIDFEFSVAL